MLVEGATKAPGIVKAAESMEQRAESEKQKKKIGLMGLIGPIIMYSPFSGERGWLHELCLWRGRRKPR
ncbi:MAG: hypothetical protein PHU49_10225 [Syntrophorhabdaceae bacterium]|nr:hypothetical protein [Syntrophorhabdaceae bacterium]MDD5244382.1 hypothetical protein [Syntrophorhabdaceae bacterium]